MTALARSPEKAAQLRMRGAEPVAVSIFDRAALAKVVEGHDAILLQEAARDLEDPIYYVSGTPGMVVGTLRLLREDSIPEDDIEVEAFRGYG